MKVVKAILKWILRQLKAIVCWFHGMVCGC